MKTNYPNYCIMLFVLMLSFNVDAQVGILDVNGDFKLTSSGAYEAEIADLSGAGTGNDLIVVDGDVNLDGTLDIILSGYTPVATESFEIMSFDGTLTGSFATINWPTEMALQGWTIDYGVLYPGKVTIFGINGSLFIDFLSFEVSSTDEMHYLDWEIALDYNQDYFLIEYSSDGLSFEEIGMVDSDHKQAYNFEYQPTQNSNHYYRIHQVGTNGDSMYSDIISIHDRVTGGNAIFPNPSSGLINYTSDVDGIVCYDLVGKEVLKNEQIGRTFDISQLNTGTYFIKILNSPESSQKLIISKQ